VRFTPGMLVLLFSATVLLAAFPIYVHAQSAAVSRLYISPQAGCCVYNTATFFVSIMVNLTEGEVINVFDVRLNYTGFYSPATGTGFLQAKTIDYSGNLFGTSGDVLAECIDAVGYGQGSCSGGDRAGGQVHMSEGGSNVYGLKTALLFRIQFEVYGTGSSVFSFDLTGLVNPGVNPLNPQLFNPHDIQVVASDGIFANTGLAAFFNYEPSTPPALLPGNSVLFDAGASLNGTSPTPLVNPSYDWNFGDGNKTLNQSSPKIQHVFRLPGSYDVQLNVTEANGSHDSIVRKLVVVPALGGLLLTVLDQRGTPIRGGILVRLFNASLSVALFEQSVDSAGQTTFKDLTPGSYLLKFSGPGYQNASRTESVIAGWTTQDNVNLVATPVPPSDNSGLLIFGGSVLAGVGLATLGLVLKRRRSRSRKSFSGKRLT